jgi:hypothetical protein
MQQYEATSSSALPRCSSSSTAATASTSVSASPSLRAVASAFSTPLLGAQPADDSLDALNELSLYDSSLLPLLPPSPPPPFDLASLELVATQLRAKLRLDLEVDLDDLDLSGADLGLCLSGATPGAPLSDAVSLVDGGDDAGYSSDDEEEFPSAGGASAIQGVGASAGLPAGASASASASDELGREEEGVWVTSSAPRHRQRKRPQAGAAVMAGNEAAPAHVQRASAQPLLPPRRQQHQQHQQKGHAGEGKAAPKLLKQHVHKPQTAPAAAQLQARGRASSESGNASTFSNTSTSASNPARGSVSSGSSASAGPPTHHLSSGKAGPAVPALPGPALVGGLARAGGVRATWARVAAAPAPAAPALPAAGPATAALSGRSSREAPPDAPSFSPFAFGISSEFV